ncbi:MAG: bifunctional phosphopantothenoylcysteine decarboxylase/phosphopantothenate--cysteine ligase CoaBC [Clostridiales bacterium]|nr:bifunctional phosphopantothenoylcysteine decarboxylase/phosphopantothenate--cysteine ligase CoaBC [Clostridiales bacterium]MCF8022721.1 bifunctional phosphopantothenoylcysteine decarboxylase/phosphopantothenate--cysteine ligase CoaBC [Clostridiales bacterium]
MKLKGFTIVVGVTGGIAAFRAVDLVSALKKQGVEVYVVMSNSAQQFVGPLTFEAISGNTVHLDILESPPGWKFPHLELAEKADAVVIAPATANFLSKAALGMADDLLSALLLGCESTVLICPAMNSKMYRHPAVQENIKKLNDLGYSVLTPGEGHLACGDTGPGRLPDIPEIISELEKDLTVNQDFNGFTVLVTAGATREPIDPVRFISNKSSGKMGFALARAACERGARTILVSGLLHPATPPGVQLVETATAREMYNEVLKHYSTVDVVIKAAAVGDYKPKEVSGQKIKKESGQLVLELEKNTDILMELGQKKNKQLLIGFAAETENLEKNAVKKIQKKNLDMVVANNVHIKGSGFNSDNNMAKLLFPGGEIKELPLISKSELAHIILDNIKKLK